MRPVMAEGTVDTLSVMGLHQQVYAALRAALHRGSYACFGARRRVATSPTTAVAACRRDVRRRRQLSGVDPSPDRDDRTRGTQRAIARCGRSRPTAAPDHAANRTAQMHHVPVGNPFSSSPAAAIANCCPGLEVDFRAVWRRILTGITLREYDNLVLECDIPGADLKGRRLLAINGEPTMARLLGPSPSDLAVGTLLASEDNPTASFTPEWSNQLAQLLKDNQGATVTCIFTADAVWEDLVWWDPPPLEIHPPRPTYRSRFRPSTWWSARSSRVTPRSSPASWPCRGAHSGPVLALAERLSRVLVLLLGIGPPDFVNVETTPDGRSTGDNWLQKERTGTYVPDDYTDERLLLYDDLLGATGSGGSGSRSVGATRPSRARRRHRIRHDLRVDAHADAP